jgi:hypothetical protein
VKPVERFTQLFGTLLVFVYHCFDRIVINGYLNGLSRLEQVVHFVREVLGIPVVSKEVLSRRTEDYKLWVEAFARNHRIPMKWAEKGVRKEDYVRPSLRRMERNNCFGVYFIFRSMEQGRTFRISVPKFRHKTPTTASWRISGAISRITTFTFVTRSWGRSSCACLAGRRRPPQSGNDPQTARLLDALARTQVLKQGTRPDELVALLFRRADRVLQELHLQTPLSHPQDLRALHWKQAFLKQYEKFSLYLRNELCSNNLRGFGLKKGLDHLDAVRQRFQTITDRFAGFQAQCLNVHVDFPLLERIALPVAIGSVRFPGIKIHDTRIIRLLEVLLHGRHTVGGGTAKQIHAAVRHLPAFRQNLRAEPASLRSSQTQRPRPRQRDGRRYAYHLTGKGGLASLRSPRVSESAGTAAAGVGLAAVMRPIVAS